LGDYLAMRIICPACEIWLVDLIIIEGEGSFWCLRCNDTASRRADIECKRSRATPRLVSNAFPFTPLSGVPTDKVPDPSGMFEASWASAFQNKRIDLFQWLKQLFGFDGSTHQPLVPAPRTNAVSDMNEGIRHSGPNGYSPNTADKETQYSSGLDEEVDWADDQG